MGSEDWYRSTEWSPERAEAFWARLKRSRSRFNKAQYVRIQAAILADAGHYVPALELLDILFRDFPERFELAAAHKTRAKCLLALGREDDAVNAFRDSISAERDYPNVQVGTAFDFASYAVLKQRRELYDEVTEALLNATEGRGMIFPVERFQLLAFGAIIEWDRGNQELARKLTHSALELAGLDHSGLRYHPKVGLVTEAQRPVLEMLVKISGAN